MSEEFYYKSPIGVLEVIVNNNALISLKLTSGKFETKAKSKFAKEVENLLDKYFNKKLKNFRIKIKPSGTDFQKKVWNELIQIPYGQTKSYKEIAELIKKPNAARAVGGACNKNPIMIVIPCHRVIAQNGKLNGFAFGLDIKKKLLELEKTILISSKKIL